MKWLTLDMIKQKLRLDYDCEDALLELYGKSAEETILEWCDRSYDEIVEKWGEFPAKLINASLLLVTISYDYGSPVSGQNLSIIPYGNIDILVKPYRKITE